MRVRKEPHKTRITVHRPQARGVCQLWQGMAEGKNFQVLYPDVEPRFSKELHPRPGTKGRAKGSFLAGMNSVSSTG